MQHYQQQSRSWHYSRIADYQACPHRDGLRRAGERQMVTPGMARGTEFHAAAARYVLACRDAGKSTLPDFAQEVELACSEEVAPIFAAFAEAMKVPVKSDVLYVERSFTAPLPNGVPFSGTLDLAYISGTSATVVDWKTFAPRWMSDPHPHPQIRSYGWLLQQVHPEITNVLGIVGAQQPNGQWRTASWPLTENDDPFGDVVPDYGHTLVALVSKIEADTECRANPLPGSCVGCSYGHVCEYHGPRGRMLLEGGPEMWALAAEWYAEQAGFFRDLIRAHVDNDGLPVSAPDGREYRYEVGEPGYSVVDYPAAVALIREADELVRTPRSKLPGVARVFKLEQDVLKVTVPALLADPRFRDRAAAQFVQKQPGKPRFGLYGRQLANMEDGNDG